jgi:hypothetical protein
MLILLWIALSIWVGMYAYFRRNRNGIGWLFLALIISPPLAFALCAILDPKPEVGRGHRPHQFQAFEAGASRVISEP